MNNYEQEIEMYFELKGSPDSSKESYLRRINAFIQFFQNNNQSIEDLTFTV